MSDYLIHYGVPGMKWGVRKSDYGIVPTSRKPRGVLSEDPTRRRPKGVLSENPTRVKNPNYSSAQRERDKRVYGRSGVRRINKSMNKGMRISEARSKEANRIYKHRRAGVVAGQVGSMVGGVGGAIGGYYVANRVLKKYGTGDPTTDLLIKSTVSAGAYKVSQTLGRYGGHSLSMLGGGYSPTKFRYG